MSDDTKKEESKKEEEKKEDKKEETKTEEKKEEKKETQDEKIKEKKATPATPNRSNGGQEEKKPAPSGKFKDLIKKIEELSVMELAELVKELEERFGVSAAQPVAVATASGAAGGEEEKAEEKSAYTIHLVDAGAQKIAVIKAVREIRQDLGLKEAKDLVDAAPKEVKADVPKAEAEEAKKKLETAGAKVELK